MEQGLGFKFRLMRKSKLGFLDPFPNIMKKYGDL